MDIVRDSVVESGQIKGKKLTGGAFATPDLNFDGQTIVFAWVENREHRWIYSEKTCRHLFSIRADGADLRQLTDGAYNDFDPCWLPSGRIAFISERRGDRANCLGTRIWICGPDGAAPHHGEVYGSLCMLDLRGADDGHMAQVRRITPE